MRAIFHFFLVFCLTGAAPVSAQQMDAPIQQLLQQFGDDISKSSRRTIGPAIDALAASGMPQAQTVLNQWQAKAMWRHRDTGAFVFATELDRDTLTVFDGSAPGRGVIPTVARAEWSLA